jgi:hypothetical protein
MVEINQDSPILAIPLELREQIYKEVFSHPSQGPELLRTCRDIYAEAHKYLFQRPLVFRGQSALYKWLESVPSRHLQHATEILLEVQDVDLRPLLSLASSGSEQASPPRFLAWELHEKDLERLRDALFKLPNVKTLTILALSESRSHLYREFLAKLLKLLNIIWPNLQGLSLEGNYHRQNLDFLASLPQLRSFTFNGFSSTFWAELATIPADIRQLESLSLVSQHGMLTPTTYFRGGFTSEQQTFTSDVLCNMRQLTSLSVTERTHPASAAALFFTRELLDTLHDHKFIRRLAVHLSQTPEHETLEALDFFLRTSWIERLELDWPGFDAAVLQRYSLLPESLKDFWVRQSLTASVSELLRIIGKYREQGSLSQLRGIVLIRTAPSNAARTQAEGMTSADTRHDQGPNSSQVGSANDVSLSFGLWKIFP